MQVADLIYGTFPDLPGSQQVVHRSDSIGDKLQGWLINSYDQFGDCRSEGFESAIAVMWYRDTQLGPSVCITKVTQQAKDFSGRWGALLRHTAVMTEQQYLPHAFLPVFVASQLVETGSSEELRQRSDLKLSLSHSIEASSLVPEADLELYREHLANLLAGERLVLFADSNSLYQRNYLNTLVALLPRKARRLLNWSQFLFKSWNEVALSVVFNSRYEAVADGIPAFSVDGKTALTELELKPEEITDYLQRLANALESGKQSEIAELLDSDDWRPDKEEDDAPAVNDEHKESDES